jgi:hypothetical protein
MAASGCDRVVTEIFDWSPRALISGALHVSFLDILFDKLRLLIHA